MKTSQKRFSLDKLNGYGNSQKNGENWLGLNWQLGLSTGWGILGLNVASAMEMDRRLKPVQFAEFGKIQPGTNGSARFIAQLNQRSEQIADKAASVKVKVSATGRGSEMPDDSTMQ